MLTPGPWNSLKALEKEWLARGQFSKEEIETKRAMARSQGFSDVELTMREFTMLAFDDDINSDDEETSEDAWDGSPSVVTIVLAKQCGFCPDCVSSLYSELAGFMSDAVDSEPPLQ